MEKYWPYIAVSITVVVGILIAIFRNQLASVGDSIVDKAKADSDRFKLNLLINIETLLTIGIILYYYYYKPFNKEYVVVTAYCLAAFAFFRLIKHIDYISTAVIDKYREEIEELKREIKNPT
jgi:hypothetical protein